MWHDMHWRGWEGHMFGWWGVIIMGVLIVAAIVIIMRSNSKGEIQPVSSDETPLDTLKRRYASGEIDRDEFEQKKRDLGR